jgi:hypothetical protein
VAAGSLVMTAVSELLGIKSSLEVGRPPHTYSHKLLDRFPPAAL